MIPPWVADLEALYRATGNPLLVWEALADCPANEPLPAWISRYLHDCATRLLDEQPPSAALGLSARGRNAYAERRLMAKEAALASDYERVREQFPGKGKSFVSLTAEVLRTTPSTVWRYIQRARQRWDAQ